MMLDFLDELLNCEVEARRTRYLRARLQLAHLPLVKNFEQFDFSLATDLGRAYREGRLDRRMRIYLAPKVLLIDEVGYLPLDDLGTTIFFQLVSARYEQSSIILTSNKSYGDWGSIFGDPIIATAILDRLLHHSTTINIRGESYRLKDRRKAGLFPRAEEETRPAPFPSSEMSQNGPRRQGSASPRKTGAPLTAPGRSGSAS